jgi:hypothetical protein
MRIIWTLVKVVIGLAIALPLAVIALGLTVGVLGALLGLAVIALKIAFIGLIGYTAFRLIGRLFGSKPAPKPVAPVRELGEPSDRYYEAAMQELDAALGRTSR